MADRLIFYKDALYHAERELSQEVGESLARRLPAGFLRRGHFRYSRHGANRGLPRRARLLFGEALLQGVHQVNDGRQLRVRDGGQFLTLERRGDDRTQAFLILVAVFVRVERRRKSLDE